MAPRQSSATTNLKNPIVHFFAAPGAFAAILTRSLMMIGTITASAAIVTTAVATALAKSATSSAQNRAVGRGESRAALGLSAEKVIEAAQSLVIEGKRVEALKRLKEAESEITASGSGAAASAKKLSLAAREIAESFLTERGQAQYAMAESLWFTKPKEAVELLVAAMVSEPGNSKVLVLGARAALRGQECSKVEPFLAALVPLALQPDAETNLLKLQAQECGSGPLASTQSLKIPDVIEPPEYQSAFRLLAVKEGLRKKDLRGARALLSVLESQDAENPEVWLWKWRAVADRAAARQYLKLCAALNLRKREKFELIPELCASVDTVESELKSRDKVGL